MTKEELIIRAFKVFDGFGGPDEGLGWRTDEDYAPVTLFVNCNDLFYWGCSDCEELNENNISELERAAEDLKQITPNKWMNVDALFCCRVRKMRPQGASYKYIDKRYWPLFNACGDERPVDIINPYPSPKE